MKYDQKITAKAVIGHISVYILFIIGLIACNYNKTLDLEITPTMNITGYLEANQATFSELLKLMDRPITIAEGKTIKYSSFLGAYGTYTMFAPTNDALLAYVHAKNGDTATVKGLSNDDVQTLLNFHVLRDTISSTNFTDGKLPVPTMLGYYLITGAVFDGSSTHIRINKQANIITKNVKLGNGIVHVIDGVLEPPKHTIAWDLENDSRFTIFTEALKKTGYYDVLNQTFDTQKDGDKWLSVLATPDSVYNANGITSYSDLEAKYSRTGTPMSPTDSLNLYVGYHIMGGLKFVADLVSGNSYNTLTPNQVVSISKDLDTILINEFTINGVLEKGAPMVRYKSDNTSTDGVWHLMNGDYAIKVRKPQPVFFDFCDYPGLRSIPPTWGSSTATSTNLLSGQIPQIIYNQIGGNYAIYVTDNAVSSSSRTYINHNHMEAYLRNGVAVNWIKFTTPFIAAGKYKVWLCYAETGVGKIINIQTTVATSATDSTDLPIVVNTGDYLPTNRGSLSLEDWDNTLLGLGYKRPMQLKGVRKYSVNTLVGRYLGAVTFTTSSTHWIKISSISSNVKNNVLLDMVQFIPFDEDQVWPKFDMDGTAWPRPPSPYDDATTAIY